MLGGGGVKNTSPGCWTGTRCEVVCCAVGGCGASRGHCGVGSFGRRGSEEFLFADCGYEFLEVEWFEVGDVFKAVLAVGAEGWLEHC